MVSIDTQQRSQGEGGGAKLLYHIEFDDGDQEDWYGDDEVSKNPAS